MNKILAFLTGNYTAIIGGVVAIAFVVVLLGKNHDIGVLRGQLTEMQNARDMFNRRLGICQGNITTLTAAVAGQNKAVEDMAATAAAREAQFSLVMAGIEKDRAVANNAVKSILARPAPADKCAGAYALVKEVSR